MQRPKVRPNAATAAFERKTAMKLLHLDSSALGANSVTRELSAAIVARWQDAVPGLTVDYRDLDNNPLPHLTCEVLTGADVAAKADGDATMDQFLASDVIVIGAPMYNFGVTSTLKAWIDRVAVFFNDSGSTE